MMVKYLVESELRHRVTQVAELGIFPHLTKLMQPLIAQPYQGVRSLLVVVVVVVWWEKELSRN